MSVAIISTKTGNGHNSVMNTLADEFKNQGYDDVAVFPTFYEDLMVSNKIMSDFYNFLMITSTELCGKFSELSSLVRPDLSEDFYNGVHDKIVEFIKSNSFSTIISTSHTLNHAFIRILKEMDLYYSIGFYIVITDPYNPISVGFAAQDAKKYYCGSSTVKNILLKSGISEQKIEAVGYPIHSKFFKEFTEKDIDGIYQKLDFRKDKKTLLINSGSQGAYHYLKLLKPVLATYKDLQIIFVCGRNKNLQDLVNATIKKEKCTNVRAFGFVDNIEELMKVSDIIITKAGANAFFECLYMQKPMIIDGINGYLFQERGVLDFIKRDKMGIVLDDQENLINVISEMLDDRKYNEFKENIIELKLQNGAKEIISDILKTEGLR
ncbi:MAG: CDP-glycerol glycerophosphotransferase family protein [Clostridia bacterium]|nr:CDP-glycerol glycerophosphotransferase family protein [Clostridia bacterium]